MCYHNILRPVPGSFVLYASIRKMMLQPGCCGSIPRMSNMASWEKLFLWSKDPYYGYVSSIDDALDLIQEYCYETATSYTATRATKCFGTFDMFSKSFSCVSFQKAKSRHAPSK